MADNPYESPEDGSRTPRRPGGLARTVGWVFLAFVVFIVLGALVLPMRRFPRPPARRMQCAHNLKQIALALHNYHDAYQLFPPAYTVDENGNPLHSWRTIILPFIDQKALYDSIDLSKPWDHPVNAEAFATDLWIYRCPSAEHPQAHTTYTAVLTPTSCLQPEASKAIHEMKDGTSQTLLLVDVPAKHAVHWAEPRDTDLETLVESLRDEMGLSHPGGLHATLADGSVVFLDSETTWSQLRAMVSVAAGDDTGALP